MSDKFDPKSPPSDVTKHLILRWQLDPFGWNASDVEGLPPAHLDWVIQYEKFFRAAAKARLAKEEEE